MNAHIQGSKRHTFANLQRVVSCPEVNRQLVLLVGRYRKIDGRKRGRLRGAGQTHPANHIRCQGSLGRQKLVLRIARVRHVYYQIVGKRDVFVNSDRLLIDKGRKRGDGLTIDFRFVFRKFDAAMLFLVRNIRQQSGRYFNGDSIGFSCVTSDHTRNTSTIQDIKRIDGFGRTGEIFDMGEVDVGVQRALVCVRDLPIVGRIASHQGRSSQRVESASTEKVDRVRRHRSIDGQCVCMR